MPRSTASKERQRAHTLFCYSGGTISLQNSNSSSVTEEFLNDSLTYYTNKYGVCTQVDNYVVFFQPNIGVMELI